MNEGEVSDPEAHKEAVMKRWKLVFGERQPVRPFFIYKSSAELGP
jgi:hypothetical protein